ncbi:unnamed protein product, partial [marine sediment metagenome]
MQQVYNIVDFGAQRDSGIPATSAIKEAITAASLAGGGTVYIPAGRYLSGAIILKSNIELNLSPGAILSFSTDPADYPVVESRWEGVRQHVYASCIYGSDLVNISITGSGTLEGN